MTEKWENGKRRYLWDNKGRRNEALDCFVYALAALRISVSRWQVNLEALQASFQQENREQSRRQSEATLAQMAKILGG